MKLEPVFFDNGIGDRVQQNFDRSYLTLGKKVFATLAPSGEIVQVERTPSTGAKPLWVAWIAPSEWYVELEGAFVVPEHFINRVTDAVQSSMTEDDVRACMARLQSGFRPEYQHTTSEWERNPLAVIFTVLERLDLLEKINQLRDQLTPLHHEELASYLMLTCFDRLGQPADWIDFGNWLEASRKKGEREVALADIKNDDLVSAAAHLHKHYTKIYGVKNSFFRFVREMISAEVRLELYASINILKNKNPPADDILPSPGDDDKLKYLFKRRNDYTHKAAFSPPCGSKLARVKSNVIQEFKADHFVTTRVHDWPNVLERAVRSGLAYYIGQHLNS